MELQKPNINKALNNSDFTLYIYMCYFMASANNYRPTDRLSITLLS